MIQAIRIEHADGYGCFCGYLSNGESRTHVTTYLLPKVSNRHVNFNTPWQDGLHMEEDRDFCAYRSVEQLREWIKPEEILVLLDNEYKVYLLELSEAQTGEHQICYRKEHILLKKEISDLFKITYNGTM